MTRQRREPKFNKSYRRALLIDAMGGGLCPIHGAYFGHGQYGLKACPFCDIKEHFKTSVEDNLGEINNV